MSDKPLIIVGASARAAAFSAHGAGYTPYWLDQFGDQDLRQRFRGHRISDYPEQAIELIGQAPDAPFIFTGALENHPGVLEQLCRQRTLLGNPRQVYARVRDPYVLYEAFQRNGVPCPEIRMVGRERTGTDLNPSPYPGRGGRDAGGGEDWLLKPLRSGGGLGIGHYKGQPVDERHYLQECLRGDSFSAVFVGSQGHCRLLGVTRQLVGRAEFHAGEFSYCGSIGPLQLNDADNEQWRHIGKVLTDEFKLKGLFGVDAIKCRDSIYPVEVNPRYPASVEVLELALGCQAIKLHHDACRNRLSGSEERQPDHLFGKAILFSPVDFTFTGCVQDSFTTADIPAPGTKIKQGQPILTVIVAGTSITCISQSLKKAADSIYINQWQIKIKRV